MQSRSPFACRNCRYARHNLHSRQGIDASCGETSLAQQLDVIAVDMETFAAAEVAKEAGVPWLAVRVVTDGATDDMPFDFNAMTGADGNVNKGRVIVSALTHPHKIPALIRLGARSSLAAKKFALFLQAYLQALPDVNG